MKILMICDFFHSSQTYQENLLTKYYRHLGHEVVVICSTYENIFDYMNEKLAPSKESCFIDKYEAKVYRLAYQFNILYRIRKFRNIGKIIHEERPDLIYVHGNSFNLHEAVSYKKKHNCKLIFDSHSDYSNSGKNWFSIYVLHKTIRKNYLNSFISSIDKIYAVTPGSVTFLNEVYAIPLDKIELLPLGCDSLMASQYLTDVKAKEKLRSELQIAPHDFVVITGGRLIRIKKTELLLEAVKQCAHPQLKVIVFGDFADTKDSAYIETLNKYRENSAIKFVGWLDTDNLYQYLAISDLAVFPSRQSVIWQQSIGMNLPLIVGDSWGQSAEYLNVDNNLIVVSQDKVCVETFKELLVKLLNNKDLYAAMQQGAVKAANEFLSYEIIAKKTLDIVC